MCALFIRHHTAKTVARPSTDGEPYTYKNASNLTYQRARELRAVFGCVWLDLLRIREHVVNALLGVCGVVPQELEAGLEILCIFGAIRPESGISCVLSVAERIKQ
jgi:hypothetical protein